MLISHEVFVRNLVSKGYLSKYER